LKVEDLVQVAEEGARTAIEEAAIGLDALTNEQGALALIAFPNTAFGLPIAAALLGAGVSTAADARKVLDEAKRILDGKHTSVRLKELGGALNIGVAALLAEEVRCALDYASGNRPSADDGWLGFLPDEILRALGVQLVDGRIAGVAVILGTPPDAKQAVQILRECQQRRLLSCLCGQDGGKTMFAQLREAGVDAGLETLVVPLGPTSRSVIYAANFAIRAPLTYGRLSPGDWDGILKYCRERVKALCIALGAIDAEIAAIALGALALGIPIISDQDVPQIESSEVTPREALLTEKDYSRIAARAAETRDIKLDVAKVPIPVPYGSAFEGERVRREQTHVEFGGKYSKSFEYLKSVPAVEIEDGNIELHGRDIDKVEEGAALPLAIVVRVAGLRMQKVFEPILERHIHNFMNGASGVFHMGQRDINWIRISKEAYAAGFRIEHLGVILHALIHKGFGQLVDRVAVDIYTNLDDVERLLPEARAVYEERDARMAGLTDEAVEVFYSCKLCQSFAPNHVCIVKPERLGLCGAYSWLDARASHEIDPNGPNQPVGKANPLNEHLGEWQDLNDYIYINSNRTIERFCAYSIMECPETSCGCFECIVAIVPEANGFAVIPREFGGMTPTGMTFGTLAGVVGGGIQNPGFMGVAKNYLLSRKFIRAEGGIKRIVWMSKELKEAMREQLQKRAQEEGAPDLLDKIADEETAATAEELAEYLAEVGHPALEMEPLL